jgi:hypothetical protein
MAFYGNWVQAAYVNAHALPKYAIWFSLLIRTLYRIRDLHLSGLTYFAFEFRSELASIDTSTLPTFSATSLLIPRSMRMSDLFYLTSFSYLSVIAIPASVKGIQNSAFR